MKRGIAIQPVSQPAKIRELLVLIDGQCPHVAMTAMAEVPAAGMVPRMASPPQIVRRECEESAETTQEVIRSTASKERMMPAVVLDDEDSNQEAGRRDRQDKCQPIRP